MWRTKIYLFLERRLPPELPEGKPPLPLLAEHRSFLRSFLRFQRSVLPELYD
jgi:hypothetical protein